MRYDFHRQKPIDRFIVDFYCPKMRLAIEIDGDSHFMKEERDAERQQRLEELGVHLLRFDDLDVKFQMDRVLKTIQEWIEQHQVEAEPISKHSPLERGMIKSKKKQTHSPLERGMRRGVLGTQLSTLLIFINNHSV